MINLLHELKAINSDRYGPKAANLGELMSFDIPVPEGFVFSDPSPAGYLDAGLLYYNTMHAKVAVRSSGIAEDSADASFAGIHDTFLDVEGVDEVRFAIAKCFASVDSELAQAYRKMHNVTNKRISVIVQNMIPAEYSGVMFTKNPVTNNANQVMIESVKGTGESLVSGSETPENYLYDKNGTALKTPNDSMLHSVHLNSLLDLGLKIEDHYKAPQDIEFSIHKGRVYILQTRPVTT